MTPQFFVVRFSVLETRFDLLFQDSVICVEEIQTTTPQSGPEKGNSQKALRSLNDVLGKTAPNKDTKVTSGRLSYSIQHLTGLLLYRATKGILSL